MKQQKPKGSKQKTPLRQIVAMVCAILVAIAFLASALLPAFMTSAKAASPLDEAKKSRQAAQEKLNEVKQQKADLVEEFSQIDGQITQAEDDITNINSQITVSETVISEKEAELSEAEAVCNAYDEAFRTRARTMYEHGGTTYLEVLLGSANFSDFLDRVELVRQIVDYDNTMLGELNAARQTIVTAKAQLEAELAQMQESAQSLELKMEELELRREAKTELLRQAEKDVAAYQKIYDAAEKAEQEEIKKQQAAMSSSANQTKYTGGRFTWPVPSSSRITSYFGYRTHPVYKTKKFHSGIDIGCGYGASILAAADGVVTVSQYNSSYGRYIIVNHGSGLSSLYAHNSSLLVSVGDRVTRGQQIAKAGSTGVSTGNHLHFEVRVNGTATNPLSYLQ